MRCTRHRTAAPRPYRPAGAAFLVGMLAVGYATAAEAQVAEHRLTTPEATLPEALSSITGLRELTDGRVMIADGLGQALLVADLRTGRADTIGGVGGGPQEYRTPDAVFPLPGDSTLLVDLGNGRLTAIGPDFRFGETMPLTLGQPGQGPGSMIILVPRGVDREGRLYMRASGGMGPGGPRDSTFVIRYDRRTQRIDSLARVGLPETKVNRSGGAGNQSVRVQPVPLSPQDGWAVAPDGRLALVRTEPYHVEWRDPSGRIVPGPAVDHRPLRLGNAEQQRWLANLGRDGLRVSVSVNNGQMQTSFARGGAPAGAPDPDQFEWPDVMPAFNAGEVLVDASGNVWVGRYTRAEDPPQYDVFDGQGRLQARVTVPAGREVVGFGNGVVYVTYRDEYDLQYLERYRIPTNIGAGWDG